MSSINRYSLINHSKDRSIGLLNMTIYGDLPKI